MREEFSFFARAETCAIVGIAQAALEFCDKLRGTTRERANLRTSLAVTDRARARSAT
jgi:hypothetical protein